MTSWSPVLAQGSLPSGDQLWQDLAIDVADEVVFDNLSSLAGSACDLFALGVDVTSLLSTDQWSYVDSLLEVTVLFRNQSWRELIWALNDEYDRMGDQLTQLKKQQCVARFVNQDNFDIDQNVREGVNQQLELLEGRIIELQWKMKYFSLVRREMLWNKPIFIDERVQGKITLLPTDKVFYWLSDAIDMNWEQLSRDTVNWLKNSWVDLRVFADQFPDTCHGLVSAVHELILTFTYPASGDRYDTFKEFLLNNPAVISEEYVESFCESSLARDDVTRSRTSAEEQYRKLMLNAGMAIERGAARLLADASPLLALINKKRDTGTLSEDEEKQLIAFLETRGMVTGMIEYHSLIMQKVQAPTSTSLTKLTESLQNFVEAVLGVIKDDQGKNASRISFSERFENRKEKQFQDICSRIAEMYSQSGRNLADLPTIGAAKGKTFCQARLDCEGVNLTNLFGASEGRKKLLECSGFTFTVNQLRPSQLTEDVIQETNEDIADILQTRALNDLLQARNLHFSSLRERFRQQYRTSDGSTRILEGILDGASRQLYQGDTKYDPEGTIPKTQYSVLKKVYTDFYSFIDQQSGYCAAPKNPSG